jgi:hypothetical protein
MEPRRQHRRVQVFQLWGAVTVRARDERVLVEVPGLWSAAVISLIHASRRHPREGLMVTNVGPGTPAAKAGIRRGDVLLRCAGHGLRHVAKLRRLVARHAPVDVAGKPLRIEGARGHGVIAFDVLGPALGVTVARLLRRTPRVASEVRGAPGRTRGASAEPGIATLTVVDTLAAARLLHDETPVYVPVPGELAGPLLGLLRALDRPESSTQWKAAHSLLAAGGRSAL